MRCLAPLALASLSACCVLVVDNQGSGTGNPFQQNTSSGSGGLPAPVAICRAIPADAGVGQLVTFDGSDSQPAPGDAAIVAWFWDFGDGAQATGNPATHAYGTAGLFVATVTVTDDQNLTAQNACNAVTVQ